MKRNSGIAIVSPHLDDAIFSLGSYMQGKNVTIVTPFGGIPEDEVGRTKYELLHEEHIRACELLGVKYVNGPFLDDVYPGLDKQELWRWLINTLSHFDTVLVPLGIKHHDHIAVREACDAGPLSNVMYYSDLPYATDYPEEHDRLSRELECKSKKLEAVKTYASQAGGTVPDRVMVEEKIWKQK